MFLPVPNWRSRRALLTKRLISVAVSFGCMAPWFARCDWNVLEIKPNGELVAESKQGDSPPPVGSTMEIYFIIEGLGEKARKATGTVSSRDDQVIQIKVDELGRTGEVAVGDRVALLAAAGTAAMAGGGPEPPAVTPPPNTASPSAEAEAYFEKGRRYFLGEGVEQNFAMALSMLEQAAEFNHSSAQAILGGMYADGLGVQRDSKKAFEWYLKSAEQGDQIGQVFLAKKYLFGIGVEKDYAKALHWAGKSAVQGNGAAIGVLGFMAANGFGVEKDLSKGIEFLNMGIQLGDGISMNYLATMYVQGEGVPQDWAKAIALFEKAAERNVPSAIDNLAVCYLEGTGVGKDLLKAEQLYLRAAKLGFVASQIQLGYLYFNGAKGFEKDMILGYAWTTIAANSGNAEAKSNQDQFAGQMSGAQVAEAQTVAMTLMD